MVSDSTKLKAVLFFLALVALVLSYYVMYLVLKFIHASEYIWFVWIFMVVFSFIVTATRIGVEDNSKKIKNLEDRVSRLERR